MDNKNMAASSSMNITIGIIGGSGLYQMEALKDIEEITIDTPFGAPSDALITGTLDNVRVVFLARHGRGHRLLPSELPFRANIYAMKSLGVKYLISASAVGSLQERIKPLDMVIPDQFIDRTQHRVATFFGDGIAAHISFGDPVCPALADCVGEAIAHLQIPGIDLHRGGTYVCMEGPAFSTKAESNLYRSWGADVIGMTNLTEAKLAREAEIAYATLAMVTDYDCWHPDHDSVTVDMVVNYLRQNAAHAQSIIRETVRRLAANPPESIAHEALKYALITPVDAIPEATKKKLHLLLKKYV
ncbi:MAG: S-methyl-5'-thioadenosine phosphorylase [Leptolyngbyaceae bacterium]|nr:S-methyl-5'-thioadenosine phosphorylase [Leptolyngbyaceae bacterium]